MADDEGGWAEFIRQSHCAWVIAKKNARIYYSAATRTFPWRRIWWR